ncbi:MAG: Wzz/FepE/Etk N-terminal domain-containing protein [Miltoncostaeaceae bacterium]
MEREITLREYGRVLWSGRWVLLAVAVAAAVVGLALSLLSTTTHTASAEITLGQATTVSGTPVSTPATNPATAATVLGSDRLVVAVARELDIDPDDVRAAVTLTAPRTAGGAAGNQPTLILLTWDDTDADRAIAGANAYLDQINAFMIEANAPVIDTLRQTVTRARTDIDRLNNDIERYRALLEAAPSPEERITLQGLLSAATSQISTAQGLLANQQIALAKAETIEQPNVISMAEDAVASGGLRGIARNVVLAGLIGLLLGIVIVFIWRGSPAGRAAPDA